LLPFEPPQPADKEDPVSVSAYLLVALGGALGSLARAWFGTLAASWLGTGFPWPTILINVLGSLLIGYAAARFPAAPHLRAFLMLGICGGFTTFSSFSLQTLDLLRAGRPGLAFWNVLLSVLLCLGAVAAGYGAAAGWTRPLR